VTLFASRRLRGGGSPIVLVSAVRIIHTLSK
jgi:hypothetical protein